MSQLTPIQIQILNVLDQHPKGLTANECAEIICLGKNNTLKHLKKLIAEKRTYKTVRILNHDVQIVFSSIRFSSLFPASDVKYFAEDEYYQYIRQKFKDHPEGLRRIDFLNSSYDLIRLYTKLDELQATAQIKTIPSEQEPYPFIWISDTPQPSKHQIKKIHRNTLVLIDFPNLLNTCRRWKQNAHRRVYSNNCLANDVDLADLRYFMRQCVFNRKDVAVVKVFSTPYKNYVSFNNWIRNVSHNWRKRKSPINLSLELIDRKKWVSNFIYEDIDLDLQRYLDHFNVKAQFKHIILISGDHRFVDSLYKKGTHGIAITVMAHENTLSNEYYKLEHLNQKDMTNVEIFTFNIEKIKKERIKEEKLKESAEV